MASRVIERAEASKPVRAVGKAGTDISQALHGAILAGGEPIRTLVDILHGTWLGHPLHPVLTDVTIGAWTQAQPAFDVRVVESKVQVKLRDDNG